MKIKKIGAAVCALAIGLSVTGCADTTWVLKYDKITMPTGFYNCFLISYAGSVSSQAAASSSTSSSTNVWSQTVSGSNAVTWAKNNALDLCKRFAIVEKLCADKKITVSKSNQTTAANAASSDYASYSSVYSKNGISQSSIERLLKDEYFLSPSLFKLYYGTKGDKAVPEKSVESYYSKNYAHIKQIFILTENTKTGKAYTGKKLAAQTKKAQTALKAAAADPAHFEKYVKLYNEDPGMKKDPNGYIFSKASATTLNYNTNFTNLAFSLKVGQVKMTPSTMGYFIEYRVPLNPKTISSTDKKTVIVAVNNASYDTMLKGMIKKEKFTVNQSTIDKFDPTKVDLTTSS